MVWVLILNFQINDISVEGILIIIIINLILILWKIRNVRTGRTTFVVPEKDSRLFRLQRTKFPYQLARWLGKNYMKTFIGLIYNNIYNFNSN
jgi:hypothetical protein